MRRVAVWAMVVMVSLLTACRRTSPSAELLGDGFTCTIEAQYQKMRVVGTVTRRSAGTLSVSFTEPATLDGLVAEWDGEQVTLSFRGLQFTVDPSSVPESALGEEVLAALDAVQRGDGERTVEDGKVTVAGNGTNGQYVLVCDADTGIPLSLSVPSLPLEVVFSNVNTME